MQNEPARYSTVNGIAQMGHVAFAAAMIVLGVLGLIKGDFTVVWQPVPKGIFAREGLVFLCALVSLSTGIGLFWRRTAALAAGVLLAFLVLWFLLWRIRAVFRASLVEGTWSCGETMVMAAAAWTLLARFATARFATDKEQPRLGFVIGDKGVRIARSLFGLGLIPFGYAHFANVAGTADLVPSWLPGHVFWAYFTGSTFIAAGVAVLLGPFARLAAALSALQMAMFALLVWVPIMATGPISDFQFNEFIITLTLTTAGWVVADSYFGMPWFAGS